MEFLRGSVLNFKGVKACKITIWTTVKTRVMEDMYSLDIGCHKMQKTEVSDGTFPNSDTPIW